MKKSQKVRGFYEIDVYSNCANNNRPLESLI